MPTPLKFAHRFSSKIFRDLSTRLSAFRRNSFGGVAAIVAILSPVLIGAMGLGGEAGYWYLKQRRIQNAADVAAHAAAMRKYGGADSAGYSAMAQYVAEQAEIDFASSQITLNTPPTSGGFTADNGAVEVVLVETIPRMFTAIYTTDPVTITARSVATADGGGAGCVVALSSTVQGAITISGSANITLTGCDMVSNASGISFDMNGHGGTISARCVQTVGQAITTPSLTVDCSRLREYSPALADPYGSVAEPAATGLCTNGNIGQNNQFTQVTAVEPHASGMSSKRFCAGLSLRGNVDFDPGLYIIEGGDFVINANASITGDGVVFYLADNVEMQFAGTADLDLAAPTTGPYAGILIFGSRAATTASHTVNGDAGVIFDGAIYTPASHLDVTGSAGTSAISCTQIIGNTLGFSGSGTINITCANTPGNDAHTGLQVVLVE